MSQKTIVTTFRCSRTTSIARIDVPQALQKLAPSGFSCPQAGQGAMGGSLGGRPITWFRPRFATPADLLGRYQRRPTLALPAPSPSPILGTLGRRPGRGCWVRLADG